MPHKNEMTARAIIEIAGKPKNHIEETMKMVIQKLKHEKGIKVLKSANHEAKEHEKIFSTFADVEVRLDDFDSLMLLCFEYMPSSIEFVEPEKLTIDMQSMTEIFNDLLGRLHQTDMMLKDANAANIIIDKNANNLLKRALYSLLKEKELTIEQISEFIGIVPEQLKPFLDKYVNEKTISKKGEKYSA